MKKGDRCDLSISGLHNNELAWGDDVESYKPERFLDESKIVKGSFMPFGGSSRICIGRDFAMSMYWKIFLSTVTSGYRLTAWILAAEMICFIAYTIRHYKITLPAHLQTESILRKGESEMERMERVLKTSVPLTLLHQKLSLEFIKRA